MLIRVKDQGPRKPLGSASGDSPAPGKVTSTAGLGAKGTAPRPPMKSSPEHTEPGGYQLPSKAIAPRAPSASVTSVTERPGGLSEGDVRTLAQAVLKEALRPLEEQIRALEARLVSTERALDRTERTLESADASGGHAAVVAPPAFVPPPVAYALPAAPVVAAAPIPKAPASEPRAIEPVRLPPKLSFDDVHLSSDELGMFDAGKRKARIATVFILVLLLGAGGLVAAMIVSRS